MRLVQQELVGAVAILRMDAFPEHFVCWHTLLRIQRKNSEHFLGPIKRLESNGAPGPTARVAQSLPFRQISLTPPQCLFGALALGDVRQHGEGAYETMLGIKHRRGRNMHPYG